MSIETAREGGDFVFVKNVAVYVAVNGSKGVEELPKEVPKPEPGNKDRDTLSRKTPT